VVSGGLAEDPTYFCGDIHDSFGADVYRKSTGDLVLRKSSAKNPHGRQMMILRMCLPWLYRRDLLWKALRVKNIALPFAICAALLVPIPTLAQRNSSAESDCYKLSSHADARGCLESRSKESAEKLSEAEQVFKSALEKSGEDAPEIARELAAFVSASAEFKLYREKQCDLQAALTAGGNAASDRRLLCEIELNDRRKVDLSAELNALRSLWRR
jgi:hypothetical protein